LRFFHFKPKGLIPCTVEKEFYEEASRTWLCRGCVQPKPGTRAVMLKLETRPPNIAVNIAMGLGVTVVRSDFLDAVAEFRADLDVGEVSLDGAVIPEFVTFRPRRQLLLRGDRRSTFRRCDVCGRVSYFPFGTPYVVGGNRLDAAVFESQFHVPLLREDLASRIPVSARKGICIEAVDVVDVANDGKGDFESEVVNWS
jgi:hypothetical protein